MYFKAHTEKFSNLKSAPLSVPTIKTAGDFYRIILRKLHKFHVLISAVSCDGLHSLSHGFAGYFATGIFYNVTLFTNYHLVKSVQYIQFTCIGKNNYLKS